MRAGLLAALLLGGCAPMPRAGDGGETIRVMLEPGFCMGKCPYYDLTAAPDGRVAIRYNRAKGQGERVRYAYVRPAEYAAFRAKLAPYRPEGTLSLDDEAHCKDLWTDAQRLHVIWTGSGPPARLIYDFGCDYAERRAWIEGLDAAVDALNLDDLPGHRGHQGGGKG